MNCFSQVESCLDSFLVNFLENIDFIQGQLTGEFLKSNNVIVLALAS